MALQTKVLLHMEVMSLQQVLKVLLVEAWL
jgi:hypothetical protein